MAGRHHRLGRDHSSLPTDRDLVAIARCGQPRRTVIEGLDLDRPTSVASFGIGIVGAIRSGLADEAHGVFPPDLPVELMKLLELPGHSESESSVSDGASSGAPEAPEWNQGPADDLSPELGENVSSRHGLYFAVWRVALPRPSPRAGSNEPPSTRFAPYEPAEVATPAPATLSVKDDGIEIAWFAPITHPTFRVSRRLGRRLRALYAGRRVAGRHARDLRGRHPTARRSCPTLRNLGQRRYERAGC